MRAKPRNFTASTCAAGTRSKVARATPAQVDVLYGGYEGKPFAAIYNNGKPRVDYFDPKSEWAQLHAGLMKAFPGQMIDFVSFSKDNKKVLFLAYSDRDPGTYYLFDRTTNKPSQLFRDAWIGSTAPRWLPSARSNSRIANGETLTGIYTAPLGKTGPQPMIVMPHGGPFGVSDTWGYDSDVQFLASRGYAVLQVNYPRLRWSRRRVRALDLAAVGHRHPGRHQPTASNGRLPSSWPTPARICTYGISFGGYSALMNPIRNPGMYKCAIGYAGVYDLPKFSDVRRRSRQPSKA